MSVSPGIPPSNPFEVLGLDRSATFDDVKMAYLRLAREQHPDVHPDDPQARARYALLRQAYDRLKIYYHVQDRSGNLDGDSAANSPAPVGTDNPPVSEGGAPVAASTESNAETPEEDKETSRTHVPEPALPGTGNRRAFYRSGSMRQSGEIVRETGPRGTGPQAARLAHPRLPAPQLFGTGHVAARAELVRGTGSVPPGDTPWMFYALLGLHASTSVVFPRIPLNLCLVLDHSSSMLRGGKVDRLKETVRGIIDQLDADDYLSIVTFGDRAEVLLPAQPLRNRALVYGAIDAMRCRGGTEISRGLAAGLTELARNASRALSHLILLTDGQTRGDEAICLERAAEAAAMNVGITAYGLGADWNSVLLDGIATPTGGHSDYIESPEEMARAFGARVHSLQSTTLHKMTLAVRTVEGYTLKRATLVSPLLRPLQLSEKMGAQACTLGDMSDNEYRILLEFALGPRHGEAAAIGTLTLSYDVPGLQREDETLTIPLTVPVAPDGTTAEEPLDPRVANALRHMTAHRMEQRAWSALNSGNLAQGTRLLKRAAEHLEESGHTDLAQVAAAEVERLEDGEEASEAAIKRIIYGTRKLA